MIVAAEPVINRLSFKQFNRAAEKRLTKWYSTGDVGIIVGQDRAIQGVKDPIKFYAQVAAKKSSRRFPHRATKSYCVPSVSVKQKYHQGCLQPYSEE